MKTSRYPVPFATSWINLKSLLFSCFNESFGVEFAVIIEDDQLISMFQKCGKISSWKSFTTSFASIVSCSKWYFRTLSPFAFLVRFLFRTFLEYQCTNLNIIRVKKIYTLLCHPNPWKFMKCGVLLIVGNLYYLGGGQIVKWTSAQ